VADVVGELIDGSADVADSGVEATNVTYAKVRVVNPMSPYATIGIGSAEYETLVVGLKSDENGLMIYPAILS
jgi:opacity protein-like surface antigen